MKKKSSAPRPRAMNSWLWPHHRPAKISSLCQDRAAPLTICPTCGKATSPFSIPKRAALRRLSAGWPQRVFQHLLIRQRRNLQVDDVVAARNHVQLQAKLDDKGVLRGVTLHTRSGSYAVDESLLDACQQGAWDENPPPEAKSEDGFYHFIFRSRINARFDATGLRGILTFLEVGLV